MTNPNNNKYKTRGGELVSRIYFDGMGIFKYRLHGSNEFLYCDTKGQHQQDPNSDLNIVGLDSFNFEADKAQQLALKDLP